MNFTGRKCSIGVKQHRPGVILRQDNGSSYIAGDFQSEIRCFDGIRSTALVQPLESDGVAECAARILKQLFWIRSFPTLEELGQMLAEFAALQNTSWQREGCGCKAADEIRADKKGLASEAATEFKLASWQAKRAV